MLSGGPIVWSDPFREGQYFYDARRRVFFQMQRDDGEHDKELMDASIPVSSTLGQKPLVYSVRKVLSLQVQLNCC